MVNLIILSHGRLAEGLLDAAEMILGEQEGVSVIGLFPGDTLESYSEKVEAAIEGFGDPGNTLILSDLHCATPSNVAMMMTLKHHVHAISGESLPMLLSVLSMRDDADIDTLVKTAAEEAADGIVIAKELFSEGDN